MESSCATKATPWRTLRLDPTLVERLHRLGFESIAELAATPRAPLALRFGSEPGRRLDQMFGRLAEPIQPIRWPELIQDRRAGDTGALYRPTRRGTLPLARAQGLGARRLDLLFHRVDDLMQAIRAGTAKRCVRSSD
jgi:protein ImuB